MPLIVALRNEKGSYNVLTMGGKSPQIVALRNEKGSYSKFNAHELTEL